MTIAGIMLARLRQRLLSSVAHFHTQRRDLWDWRVPLAALLDPATIRYRPTPTTARWYLGGLP